RSIIGVVSDRGVITQRPDLYKLQAIEAPLDGGDAAYFRIVADDHCELWRSDGTADGLRRLVPREVCGDAFGYHDGWTARAGTHVLFKGGFGEDEPFVVDDTPAGAHRLRDINAATGRTLSTNFSTSPGTALGDVLLFNVASDSQLWLWRSDGTADG